MTELILTAFIIITGLTLMKYVSPYDPIEGFRIDFNLNSFKRLIGIKPKEHQDMTMGEVMGGMAPPDVQDQSLYEIPPIDTNTRGLVNIKLIPDDGIRGSEMKFDEPEDEDISDDTLGKLDDFLKNN